MIDIDARISDVVLQKINWINLVKKEEMSLTDKEERNILQIIKRRKSNWIVHILRRNCLLKLFDEGKVEVTGRRRSKQLLVEEKESYWNLRGSSGSHSLEYSLCQKLRTSRKIYYVVVVVVVIMEVMHVRTHTGVAQSVHHCCLILTIITACACFRKQLLIHNFM